MTTGQVVIPVYLFGLQVIAYLLVHQQSGAVVFIGPGDLHQTSPCFPQ